MLRERGIAFSQPLVGPVRLGVKTETRRLVRVGNESRACPYGTKGDGLWVRETFSSHQLASKGRQWGIAHSKICDAHFVVFKQDWSIKPKANLDVAQLEWQRIQRLVLEMQSGYVWRPPMHLPRWASRIDLEVVETVQERVQDITEAAAVAEGFTEKMCGELMQDGPLPLIQEWRDAVRQGAGARFCFKFLWGMINGSRDGADWDDNPLVWVVKFKLR